MNDIEARNLIDELCLALEVCAAVNRTGGSWSQDSAFQRKIDELLDRAEWQTETEKVVDSERKK